MRGTDTQVPSTLKQRALATPALCTLGLANFTAATTVC